MTAIRRYPGVTPGNNSHDTGGQSAHRRRGGKDQASQGSFFEKPDGHGLYLVVQPSGLKSWAVRYRRDGIPRKYTIDGSYPTIGLKVAHELAKAALESVARGADPSDAKKIVH